MDQLVREELLANGLTIRFVNRTRHYYGDFYRVIVEITCRVPVAAAYLTDAAELAATREVLGEELLYRRSLEQMGVPSTEIDRVVERLLDHFTSHSLPYIASPQFPRKMLSAELRKVARTRERLSMPPVAQVSHE